MIDSLHAPVQPLPPPAGARTGRLKALLLTLFWGVALVGASLGMWLHAAEPGQAAEAPPLWPEDSALGRTPDRPTLLVFAHPACACTRATLHELARLLERKDIEVDAQVVFEDYEGIRPLPQESESWHQAQAISGLRVSLDAQRREASLFGALTSGQVLLYDPQGVLRFSGGLTPARGETGESSGARQLIRLLTRQESSEGHSPVYGCSLLSSEAERVDRLTN